MSLYRQARFASQPSSVAPGSSNSGGELAARVIDVLEFAAARAKEMKAMETAIAARSGVRRVVNANYERASNKNPTTLQHTPHTDIPTAPDSSQAHAT